MYEHKSAPLLTPSQFARRVAAHLGIVIGAIAVSLLVGTVGYHYLAGMRWIDSVLNASMILGGMVPVDHIDVAVGMVFESCYVLFSCLFFIGVLGAFLELFVDGVMLA